MNDDVFGDDDDDAGDTVYVCIIYVCAHMLGVGQERMKNQQFLFLAQLSFLFFSFSNFPFYKKRTPFTFLSHTLQQP